MLEISKKIIDCFKRGNKIFWAGNGGSATMASHASAEFVGKFEKDRKALPSIALTTDLATITAVGNDYGYKHVFSRQLEALGKEGDILLTLSTSGTSENITEAHRCAEKLGMEIIAFPTKTSFLPLEVNTAYVQEEHLNTIHQIAREVEGEMFS